MTKPRKFSRVAIPLLFALLVSACDEKSQPSPSAAAPTDPMQVNAPETLIGQIKVEPIGTAPVSEAVRVAGRIDFDEQHLARIGATVTGRITEVLAVPGQAVRAGEPLAMLNSTELGAAQLGYLKARAQADLAERAAERARSLHQADVIGAAELQRRESEFAIAAAERRAAQDNLRVLGLPSPALRKLDSEGAINSLSPVVSSIAGVVVDRRVTQGQVVQPSDTLFTVADLSRVWALAQVPEEQAAKVLAGQTVSLEVPALGNERITGHLIHVGETVNPETRTVLVRTEIDNRERRLKPAMLATMLIAGKPVERAVVPASAVIRDGNADHVFIALDGGKQNFRLTPANLGPEQNGRRAVLSGLKLGDRIVIDGAFHLNNERKRQEREGS